MGGRPKGHLATRDGGTVASRTVALARLVACEVVLVGRADAYVGLGLESVADAPGGGGPLAGLVALLMRAGEGDAIALACDMPYITTAMIERLATHAPGAAAVAPRQEGAWSPFFARYDAGAVLACAKAKLADGAGPRAVLDAVGATELPLDQDERRALRDWDTPEDVDA